MLTAAAAQQQDVDGLSVRLQGCLLYGLPARSARAYYKQIYPSAAHLDCKGVYRNNQITPITSRIG